MLQALNRKSLPCEEYFLLSDPISLSPQVHFQSSCKACRVFISWNLLQISGILLSAQLPEAVGKLFCCNLSSSNYFIVIASSPTGRLLCRVGSQRWAPSRSWGTLSACWRGHTLTQSHLWWYYPLFVFQWKVGCLLFRHFPWALSLKCDRLSKS